MCFLITEQGEVLSFSVEITADIFGIKDKGEGYLVDKVLDKSGLRGTGKWTVQQAAELSIAKPIVALFLDARFLSGLKEERVELAKVFRSSGPGNSLDQAADKAKLIDDVRQALYASQIYSFAQVMNLILAKSIEKSWDLKLAELTLELIPMRDIDMLGCFHRVLLPLSSLGLLLLPASFVIFNRNRYNPVHLGGAFRLRVKHLHEQQLNLSGRRHEHLI